MNDPASLQNLNDIVVPQAVSWWPPAPGWYVVAAVMLLSGAFWCLRRYRHWQGQAYRREALRLLASIRSSQEVALLPGLLKRTAVAAWPREQVAALSGAAWHRFLDQTAGMEQFRGATGLTLDSLAYGAQDSDRLAADDLARLFDAAEFWVKHHRPAAPGVEDRKVPARAGEGA